MKTTLFQEFRLWLWWVVQSWHFWRIDRALQAYRRHLLKLRGPYGERPPERHPQMSRPAAGCGLPN